LKRSIPAHVDCVNIGAGCQQYGQEPRMAATNSRVQRRLPVPVGCSHIGAVREKRYAALDVAFLGCAEKVSVEASLPAHALELRHEVGSRRPVGGRGKQAGGQQRRQAAVQAGRRRLQSALESAAGILEAPPRERRLAHQQVQRARGERPDIGLGADIAAA
jgi:hypothetical protein